MMLEGAALARCAAQTCCAGATLWLLTADLFTECAASCMQGGKGRGGGGGDEGEGAFDWRAFVQSLIRSTGKTARSVGQATGALLLLLAIFYGASLVKPAAAAGLAAVRWLLRLDGRGSRRVRSNGRLLGSIVFFV